MRYRPSLAVGLVSLVALFAASIPNAAAQESDEDGDAPAIEVVEVDRLGCEVGGRQAMCDGFYWGSADAVFTGLGASQQGVNLDLSADFDSTFYLDVIDAQTTGMWNIKGDWHMIFSGEVDGIANVTMTGTGEASGDAAQFTVSGTERNEGTVTILGTNQPISNSGPLPPVEVEVTGGNCVEVTGEWRLSWAALAAEVGWTGVDGITGSFTALRQEQFDLEVAQGLIERSKDGSVTRADIDAARLPDIVKDFVKNRVREQGIIESYNSGGAFPGDILASEVLRVAYEYERIAAVAKNLTACEIDVSQHLLSQFSGWPARTIANWARIFGADGGDFSGQVVRQFTEAAFRTGALGPGSSLSAKSQDQMRENLGVTLQKVLERTLELRDGDLVSPTRDDAVETLEAARAAYNLGLVIEIHGEDYATHTPRFVEQSQEDLENLYVKPLELDDDE